MASKRMEPVPITPDRSLVITEAACLGILNGPDYDALPKPTKDLLHVQCQYSLGKHPAAYSRFVALNWNYAPRRIIYELPEQLVTPGARKFNPFVRVLERLKPAEIDDILRKDPRILADYMAVKDLFWQFRLEHDFPTRSKISKFSLPWMTNLFNRNPLELYLGLMQPARQFSVNMGPNMNPWGGEEPWEDIENFLSRVVNQVRQSVNSRAVPAFPGDVIWFNRQGIWSLWDGERLHMPDDYGEDEAHLPEWISFPEYPLDHYRNLNPRQDLRRMVHLDEDVIFKRPPPRPANTDFQFTVITSVQELHALPRRELRELADGLIIDEANRTIKIFNVFGEEFIIGVADMRNSQRSVREMISNSRSTGTVYWNANANRGEIVLS